MIEWTYCTDKLPEEEGKYLVSVIRLSSRSDEYTGMLEFANGEWRYWESSFGGYFYVKGVYAWAPLPKPALYKKED